MLQGVRNNLTQEPYVLISKGEINLSNLKGSNVGVVDFIGKNLQSSISDILNTEVKVKRLREDNDIIPTLIFNSTDMVFAPRRILPELRKRTHSNLEATDIYYSVDLISVSIKGGVNTKDENKVKKCMNSFDEEINSMLEVDSWK
ncbi:MAG: hypothetical protein KZQ74_02285 [gamma proteobacterium symbiont of Bathyaustriella thionipta]|nr:hypothetical protein [gamma proteobacterium symbiont of Bathyaustriella thionipta]MCU7966023.1 hypothetical protein [gamma proteobacterium symbiont of Bathyaustriella thionipta]